MRIHRLLIAMGFLVLMPSACKVASVAKGIAVSGNQSNLYTHYYTDNPQRLLFKTALQISSERFSGLLIVKQMVLGEYRSVFTTETGFKVFDFTVRNDGYSINYGVGPTAEKLVADRLVYTIQAMLLRNFSVEQHKIYCSENYCLQAYSFGKYVYELKRMGASKYVESQAVYKSNKKKAEAIFYGTQDNTSPDSCLVNNIGFPLQATFRLIKE